MASTGHSSLQVPHMMQSSVILCVISSPLIFDHGIQLVDDNVGVPVVHEGAEGNGFHPGSRAIDAILPKMPLENLAALRIHLDDLPDVHFLVDFCFHPWHPSLTSSFLSGAFRAIFSPPEKSNRFSALLILKALPGRI
jgi:hypothetical protein